MLINELPDDCLLAIFTYLNNLDDLINSFKVCVKWMDLVTKRTREVKYLISFRPVDSSDCVYYSEKEPIDETVLSKLFGKLEILDYSSSLRENFKLLNIIELIRSQRSLKGMIHGCPELISEYCNQLEMISANSMQNGIAESGYRVKQLHLWNCGLHSFRQNAHYFPNLERLHVQNTDAWTGQFYHDPGLEKLKIVELSSYIHHGRDTFYGFQFMDSCPSLQSAYIVVYSGQLFIDESLKNKCLQDLVLQFVYRYGYDWNKLKGVFMKYPNLKHLALRCSSNIKDEQIEQIIQILPNLVLFDVRGCHGVTQSAADCVKLYCKRYGRSIKFYFDGNEQEIKSDWPLFSTKEEVISRGFDFMKHCFLKPFDELPTFLVLIDY